jgi:hypothetical protein
MPGFGGSLFSRTKKSSSNRRNDPFNSDPFSDNFSDRFSDPFGGLGFGFSSSFGRDPFSSGR